jgi:hypothetical protein
MAARLNPSQGGKPDKLMRGALLLALHRKAEDAEGRPTKRLALVANALVEAAIQGDVLAIREIYDRVDGKPSQALDVSGTVVLTLEALLERVVTSHAKVIEHEPTEETSE